MTKHAIKSEPMDWFCFIMNSKTYMLSFNYDGQWKTKKLNSCVTFKLKNIAIELNAFRLSMSTYILSGIKFYF